MSERTFFELRHALPGFVFILWGLAINPDVVIKLFVLFGSNTGFGVFFGFFTLLSGSGIGFLVSQLWWFVFQFCYKGSYGRPIRPSMKYIIDKYNLDKKMMNGEKIADDVQKMITIRNYLVFYKTDKNILDYLSRRSDMYHLLSSVLTSFLTGTGFAILGRIIIFKMDSVITRDLHIFPIIFSYIIPIPYWIFLIIFFLVPIIVSCWYGRNWVQKQSQLMTIALIDKKNISPEELTKVFP